MSSLQSDLRSTPSLPAAVETWIRAQESSFNLEELRTAVPEAAAVRDLADRLAAHPSVARVGDAFHTPRTLARRTSFVVRLLPEEREKGILIVGHRFLPFVPIDPSVPIRVRVRTPGRVVETESARVSTATAITTSNLLRPLPPVVEIDPAGREEVDAIYLESCDYHGRPPAEMLVRCIDFDKRHFSLSPHPPATTKRWREMVALLGAELARVIQSPPPGPVTAPRQLLHVVAACLAQGFVPPVGPLGPLLSQYPKVELGEVSGRPAYALDGVDASPAPSGRVASQGSPLAAQLEKHLQVAEQTIKGGVHAHGGVSSLRWDPELMRLSAQVIDVGYWGLRTSLLFSDLKTRLGYLCDCDQFDAKGVCRHGISLLRETIRLLGQPGDSLAATIHAELSRPAWSRTLEKLGQIAQTARRVDAPREERMTWRVRARKDTLAIEPYVQKARAAGSWTPGRATTADRIAYAQEPSASPQDVEAVRAGMWHGITQRAYYSWKLDAFETLVHLIGHPCVFWEDWTDIPLRLERTELRLAFVANDAGECVPVAAVGGVPLDDPKLWWTVEGGIILRVGDDRLLLAPTKGGTLELLSILAREDVSFPEEARAELIDRLPAIEALLPVDLPAELAGEEVPADTTLRLRLAPEAPSGLVATLRVRPLAGGPIVAPGSPPERLSGAAGEKRVCVRRDLLDEIARAKGVAQAIGLPPESEPWTWRIPSDDEALDLVARLSDAPPPGVVVEWADDARKLSVSREATPKDLRVSVQDAQDWFGIEGELDVDGAKVPLAAVIEALRAGRRYVAVTGGMWVRISNVFRERLREMGDLLHVEHGKLTVGVATAPLLRDVVKETGLLKACASWNALLKRFDRAMTLAPDPPKGLTADLRPYQVEGYRWLARLAAWGVGGCLADDMGLGKTVQALGALVDRAKEGPALVLAPTSVSANWIAETKRFAPGLKPILYRETDRDEEEVAFAKGDVVVVSYAMALRDVERLAKVAWGTLVLDEAQFVKNSQTKTAQAVRRIAAGWRLALTGTPIENHLGDLWSLFRAISPGVFGSWERFRERFAAPIERDKDPKRREALARMVRPFVLRRTKDEVLKELPERTEVRLDAVLSAGERKLYDQARLGALAALTAPKDGEDRRFEVLAALTRLRQFACHPRLVLPDAQAESAKLTLFLETVEELREEGHRALVFSQFTSLLAIVREALDARKVPYRYLDGSTPAAKRDEEGASFQRGEGDLFLISLKAGGTGLNLTAADYVIHLDPWWNPAVEDQATNRAHRIGQTRPVTVYRIVAQGTIEEKILALHASKRDLVAGVLDGTDRAAKLSTDELIALIREG